jgi:hypothetical protein
MQRHLYVIAPRPAAGRPAKVIKLEARRQARRALSRPQPAERPPEAA